jgi:hypothetical protein
MAKCVMPIGRPLKELVLTPAEQAKLELMARRPKTDQRTAQRARIAWTVRWV